MHDFKRSEIEPINSKPLLGHSLGEKIYWWKQDLKSQKERCVREYSSGSARQATVLMYLDGMSKSCSNLIHQFHFHHGWMTFSAHGILNRIMGANDTDIDSAEVTNRGTVILDESDPRTVIECLPSTVFPVMIRFSLGKSTNGDRTHEELHTPDYPVDVRIPQGAYIPESTVYFDNPAERPPRNATAWRPNEFIESLSELLTKIDSSPYVDTDRLQFTDLCVAEIAPRYTTNDPDTGATVATPELYKDQADITLGYFRREGSLAATQIRDSLDTAMPGETRSPPQLLQVTEATAKPARSSRETQQPAGRHKYFTEGEAERIDQLDATPANWMLDRVAPATSDHRSLNPVLSEIDQFFPQLSETDLLEFIRLRGRTESSERFYANEVLSR